MAAEHSLYLDSGYPCVLRTAEVPHPGREHQICAGEPGRDRLLFGTPGA